MRPALQPIVLFLCILGTGIVWPEDEPDYGRTCLALVGFSEARSEGDAGMAAVMQVVLNRSTDPKHRWPEMICDVAMQSGQFQALDNWPTPRHPELIDPAAWERAQALANDVIEHTAPVPKECATATSFNQSIFAIGSVCKINKHAFFVSD